MAFIETLSEDQASADVRQMYEKDLQKFGYIPNYTRLFSHRPQLMAAWGNLLSAIRGQMDMRRYELVTLAAARALHSSYCVLAHGKVLHEQFFSAEELALIATDHHFANLTPAEVAMMDFAEQIVKDASVITEKDIQKLRTHGFSDAEIFEITTTVTARCFFSKTLDALGAEPDESLLGLQEDLRQALTTSFPVHQQNS